MISTLWLALAIAAEVAASLCLRATVTGRNAWYAGVASGYPLSFYFLTLALRDGLGIGVAYGIWAAAGVSLIALTSRVLFNETLTRRRLLGIALIAVGVAVVEVSSNYH